MPQTDPTLARAEQVLAAGTPAADLTGVELLALFERKARQLVDDPAADGATTKRAAAMAITYGQEARQRYTEALAHLRGTHNPVDLEALDRAGVSAEQERARFEDARTITIKDIRRLHLQPGDTLVLTVPAGSDAETFVESLRDAFPDHRTAVLEDDIDLHVVSAPPDAVHHSPFDAREVRCGRCGDQHLSECFPPLTCSCGGTPSDERTILVACGTEQANAFMDRYHLSARYTTIVTTDQGWHQFGSLPLAANVVLLDGWETGRYAREAEHHLRRALAKREQRFEDCIAAAARRSQLKARREARDAA